MLQQRAMLATLTIRQWTARKLDKKVNKEVEQTHNAKDAGNFNKLLVDKAALQPLQTHCGKVRDYHYQMTLPWGDNGDRLLPAEVFFDYTQEMRSLRSQGDQLADAFAKEYPNMVAAARTKLGTLYDANDYPPVSDIRNRFGIELNFAPVPDAKDFRVDVGEEAAEEIKKNIMEAVKQREVEAVKECWNRLYDVVSKIETTLTKEKPIFRDSLIDNAKELIGMLPKLNFSGDSNLIHICGLVNDKLIVDPDRLRRSGKLRNEIANHATDVLQQICLHRG